MRTLAMLALAALLAACGDDDDDDGGGGGGSNVTLTGPLAGTLTNGTYAGASGSCDPGLGTTVGFAGAFVVVSTAANQCSEALAGREVANATSLFVTVAKFNLTGAATSLDPGTYPLDIPSLDGRVALIALDRSGTSAGAGLGCTTVASPTAVTGSVNITSVSSSSISGNVSATFDDGTSASGSFSASTCGIALTIGPDCEPSGLPDPTTCTM
jgi:hypothetical protein